MAFAEAVTGRAACGSGARLGARRREHVDGLRLDRVALPSALELEAKAEAAGLLRLETKDLRAAAPDRGVGRMTVLAVHEPNPLRGGCELPRVAGGRGARQLNLERL